MRAYERILTTAAVTAAVLATATGAAAATETKAATANQSKPAGKVDPGWRLESSLGVQIAVPTGWAINDSGCGMTARPSVVRAKGMETLCFTEEPPTKELAIIEEPPPPGTGSGASQSGTATTVNGVAAIKGTKRLTNGRYAGWISVPSRHVTVDVRARDSQTAEHILGSVQLVDADHLGCPTTPPSKATAPTDPNGVTVCYYGGKDRLQASAEITGDDAQRLAASLNAAPPGRNPDRSPQTCDASADSPSPDAVLLTTNGTVRVRFSSCAGRGVDDGARTAQVTRSIVEAIMAPIHTGYTLSDDLPG